jgi:hypothetical protein
VIEKHGQRDLSLLFATTLNDPLTDEPAGYGDGLNLYALADNNTFNRHDPSGLDPEDDPLDRSIDNGWTIAGAGIGSIGGETIGRAGGTLVVPGSGTIAGANVVLDICSE